MASLLLLAQAAPGHKRAPSDASVASSEDDKVPPTPSTLESVTEMTEAKPAEDRTSDKLSDEGLGTSEVDKNEEEKLNEVSDVSNEDLVPGIIEPNKDLISQDATEPEAEDGQPQEIPAEPVVSQPEEPVDTGDTQELVTDDQETGEEQKEMREEKTNDEIAKVIKDEREPEEVKEEEKENEAATEESIESEEQPNNAQEELESIPGETTKAEEESKGPDEEMSPLEVTENRMEDGANGTDVDTENIESSVKDTNINGETDTEPSVNEPPAENLLEKETIESLPKETLEVEAPEETEQPQQDDHPREEVEVEEQAPAESTNGVTDKAKDTSEGSEQAVPCGDVLVKEDEEKATNADESTSQDAVSVPESETDSESKIEHGSPAVNKPDMEKDSDSGSSSAADSSSFDLNLSISSFLSKSKEGGSVSMQVI